MRGTVAKRLRQRAKYASAYAKDHFGTVTGLVQVNRCHKVMRVGTNINGLPIQVPASAHGTLVWGKYSFRGWLRSIKTGRSTEYRPS